MALVTIEECLKKVDNHFELVLMSALLAKKMTDETQNADQKLQALMRIPKKINLDERKSTIKALHYFEDNEIPAKNYNKFQEYVTSLPENFSFTIPEEESNQGENE